MSWKILLARYTIITLYALDDIRIRKVLLLNNRNLLFKPIVQIAFIYIINSSLSSIRIFNNIEKTLIINKKTKLEYVKKYNANRFIAMLFALKQLINKCSITVS